jgi:hypothetical protein
VVLEGARVSIGYFYRRACDLRGQCLWENKIKMGRTVPCETGVKEETEWNIDDILILAAVNSFEYDGDISRGRLGKRSRNQWCRQEAIKNE